MHFKFLKTNWHFQGIRNLLLREDSKTSAKSDFNKSVSVFVPGFQSEALDISEDYQNVYLPVSLSRCVSHSLSSCIFLSLRLCYTLEQTETCRETVMSNVIYCQRWSNMLDPPSSTMYICSITDAYKLICESYYTVMSLFLTPLLEQGINTSRGMGFNPQYVCG